MQSQVLEARPGTPGLGRYWILGAWRPSPGGSMILTMLPKIVSNLVGFIGFIVVCVLIGMVVTVIQRARNWRSRPAKAASWPVAEGTIQFVDSVLIYGFWGYSPVDTAEFSYSVNDEYYSGKLMFSRQPSTQGRPPQALINQKIQVRYDPRKPEKYSVPNQEVIGFLLRPYGT